MVHLLQCSSSSSVHILFFFSFFFSIMILTSSMEMEVALSESDASRRLLPAEDTGGGTNNNNNKQEEEAALARSRDGETTPTSTEGRRGLIGSRPPRCERVCMPSCGHCEAVQVPIVPREDKEEKKMAVTLGAAMSMFSYRVDGITNYKPLSWKCRCGGTILDP